MSNVDLCKLAQGRDNAQSLLDRTLQAAARAAEAAATKRADQLVGKLRAAVRKGKALEAQREELQAQANGLRSQLEVSSTGLVGCEISLLP